MATSHDDDDGPPPLEDMTEQLEKMKSRCKSNPRDSGKDRDRVKKITPPHKGEIKSTEESRTEFSEEKKSDGVSGTSFGGFRKGFLSGSNSAQTSLGFNTRVAPTKTPSANSDDKSKAPSVSRGVMDDDDVIRPKISDQDSKSSGLEFPEVQEAMKESFPFLNAENWLTDNLLDKIEKDPVLCNAFRDPALSQVLAQFQANPQAALAATKDKPEVQKFLQSFCALMGEHFSALGESGEKEKSKAHISEVASEEETLMKEILSKPEVKTVLEDPLIRELIETMKSDPESAQRLFYSSNPNFKLKVKVLVDHGLLAIQS